MHYIFQRLMLACCFIGLTSSELRAEMLCGRISVATFATTPGPDSEDIIKTTSVAKWLDYGTFWGYRVNLFNKKHHSKVQAILEKLEEKVDIQSDYVVWVDEDVLPASQDIPLEQCIQEAPADAEIIVTKKICSGIISDGDGAQALIFKNCDRVKNMLKILMPNAPADDSLREMIDLAISRQNAPKQSMLQKITDLFLDPKKSLYAECALPFVVDLSALEKKQIKQNKALKKLPLGPIALVTLTTPDRVNFNQYALPALKRYANRWGYDLFIHAESLDRSRQPTWSKIKAVQALLHDKKYSYVVWVDDDIFITNPDKSIESFIELAGAKAEFIISAHMERPVVTQDINAGLFIVKNSRWTMALLDRIWDIGNYRYANDGALDQAAIIELVHSPEFCNDERIVRFPGRIIQSLLTLLKPGCRGDYGQWQPGDFAAHMAAASRDFRSLVFKQFAQNPAVFPALPAELRKTNYIIKQEQPLLAAERGWFAHQ